MVATRQATGSLPPTKRVEYDLYGSGKSKRRNAVAKSRKKRVQESEESEDHDPKEDTAQQSFSHSREIRSIWYSGRVDKAIVGEKSKANRISLKPTALQAKRLPTAGGKKGRDHGKLALLMTMPTDIFCEIASYMAPLDILNLSRTSKSLRCLLMSKRSRQIWRAAQHNLGLPDCPPDICEPQYAKLVFERLCHVCGAPGTQKADFAMRIRLCKGCMSLNAGQGFTFTKPYGKEVMRDTRIYKLAPFYQSARNTPIKEDYLKFQRFYKPDFEEALERYLMLAPDSAAQDKFVAERVMVVEEVVKHAVEIENWLEKNSQEKNDAKEAILIRRQDSIVANLMELGYSRDKILELGHQCHQIFEQPRDLTDRIWTGIRPKLEAALLLNRQRELERVEKERLFARQHELSEFYDANIQTLRVPDDERVFLPSAGDFCCDPNIAAVLCADYCKTEFTKERWETLLPTLPEVFIRHKFHIISRCVSALSNAYRLEGLQAPQPPIRETCSSALADEQEILCLATSFFTYHSDFPSLLCSPLTFPTLVDHPSIRGREYWSNAVKWIPWGTYLTCKGNILRAASTLLANLGLRESTTMVHMESLGRRLICKCCDPIFQKKMTWTELLRHFGKELDWYTSVQKSKEGLAESSIPIVNDHDLHSTSLSLATSVHLLQMRQSKLILKL
ncbi:hypothetical protein BD410DRAFT_118974 [Rickenella mellea]|uniref:F-box domain-containing protein n=1 Tax=Rickenella mellea TaxID=50990 RepID=A0A4Y7QAV5_9AGAM|nr:hypothetical protein BD410DRAFT_118974 [Rickenella mellea]